MTCEIIAVGTELLLGQIANTNAQYISQKLSELGVDSYFQTVVGDNPQRLTQALKIALDRSDVIITTGGLGPTKDDLTKEVIAEFCGLKCVLHEPSLDKMKKRFFSQNSYMADNNIKQAEMPKGCTILPNDNGTAPGALIEHNGKTIIMLPGPPFEMKPMFSDSVFPYFRKKTNSVIFSKTLRVFGIGESALEEKLIDIIKLQSNPTIAPYAKQGEVTLRLTAKADTKENAEEMLIPLEKMVREILKDTVYGEGEINSLENTVCQLLIKNNLKLSTAESCTGGLIAQKITSIPGASSCFDCGVVTYSNEQKTKLLGVKKETLTNYGAVSRETALEMSLGARFLADSDIGISVTGIAGPDGGTDDKPVGLVYMGLSSNDTHIYKEFRLAGDREIIRARASMHALDMIRKYIEGTLY